MVSTHCCIVGKKNTNVFVVAKIVLKRKLLNQNVRKLQVPEPLSFLSQKGVKIILNDSRNREIRNEYHIRILFVRE